MGERSTVTIPGELRDQIEQLIEDTGFQNVSEFTRFVLRDIAAQGAFEGPEEYGQTTEKVRKRLKELGYIEG